MKEQSNPVDTDQTEMAEKASGRRRLVRGAVALAPLVLTLRSGGLAAASAGAAVVAFAEVDKHKNISNIRVTSNRPVQVGDKCVTDYAGQDGVRITIGSVDTNSITMDTNGSLLCGDAKAPQTANQKIQVAILSSSSTSSL
jgi:hypothetical protein